MARVTILLCDAAQVADGKLHILGGGWSVTGPAPTPSAVAALIELDWTGRPSSHHWELFLEDTDGRPVFLPGPDGASQTVEARGDLQLTEPVGLAPGAPIAVPLAVSVGPLPLQPGSRYTWRFLLDGQTEDGWSLTFSTRPAMPEEVV